MGFFDRFSRNRNEDYSEEFTPEQNFHSTFQSSRIICQPDENGVTRCKKYVTTRRKSSEEPWREETIEEEVPYDQVNSPFQGFFDRFADPFGRESQEGFEEVAPFRHPFEDMLNFGGLMNRFFREFGRNFEDPRGFEDHPFEEQVNPPNWSSEDSKIYDI